MCLTLSCKSKCKTEITIKSLRIFTKDSSGATNETIYLNKFEIAEAEIALLKEMGMVVLSSISLRINRLDIDIKHFTPCS